MMGILSTILDVINLIGLFIFSSKTPVPQKHVMKVVFIAPWNYKYGNFYLNGNGIEQQIIGISKVLQNLGFEVYILTRTKKQFMDLNNIPIIEIPTRSNDSMFSYIDYSINAAKYIKKMNPNIVHLTEIITAYFTSKLKNPKIYTVHTVPNEEMKLYRKRSKLAHYFVAATLKKIEKSVFKNSDAIVILNETLERHLMEYKYKMSYIPNGIDINSYSNCSEDATILYAGRLSPLKNVETLIYAFSKIESLYPTYKLQIIGSGNDKSNLEEITRSLNLKRRVEFIENVPNDVLKKYLARCTIFVLPSLFETFGIVVIEAMASGKPVIASNIPGPNDIITNGHDGILFDSKNVDELEYYLIKLINDPYLRMKIGSNAKQTITKYSYDNITNEYLKIYASLVENNNVNS